METLLEAGPQDVIDINDQLSDPEAQGREWGEKLIGREESGPRFSLEPESME